jgi:hypothetical protein
VSDGPGVRPEPDVYTVLLILATILAAGATIYLVIQSKALFGTANPF